MFQSVYVCAKAVLLRTNPFSRCLLYFLCHGRRKWRKNYHFNYGPSRAEPKVTFAAAIDNMLNDF